MERVGDPSSYLGVPTIWGQSKKSGLAYIKGRLIGKLQGWKKTTLSQAGQEVFMKAVVQAIPAYPMNLFKFPASLCNEFDAMISKLWWGKKRVSTEYIGFLERSWVRRMIRDVWV